MKITIRPTGETAQLANASQGSGWRGTTETGTPVVAIVVTLACPPEHRAEFERDFGMTGQRRDRPAANDDGKPVASQPAP